MSHQPLDHSDPPSFAPRTVSTEHPLPPGGAGPSAGLGADPSGERRREGSSAAGEESGAGAKQPAFMRAFSSKRKWAESLVGLRAMDRYSLDSLIDVGGMGAVFRATHLELDTQVAVKVLLPMLIVTEVGIKRFRREAQRAAKIRRRGVAQCLDFGVDDQLGPVMVMEVLEGEDLSKKIMRERRLSVHEAGAIGLDLLATLEAVHAQNILHRDLKPGNVFLAREGEERVVKILDFGIARSLEPEEGESMLTLPGGVVGTPRFMAPEQARGRRDIDPRADLYAIGAILYVALSGRVPYEQHDSNTILAAVITGPTASLGEVAPDLPRPLIEVIDRAMAHDREDRFEDALSMRRALAEALGVPLAALSSSHNLTPYMDSGSYSSSQALLASSSEHALAASSSYPGMYASGSVSLASQSLPPGVSGEMAMPMPASKPTSPIVWVLGTLLAVVVIGLAFWWGFGRGSEPDGASSAAPAGAEGSSAGAAGAEGSSAEGSSAGAAGAEGAAAEEAVAEGASAGEAVAEGATGEAVAEGAAGEAAQGESGAGAEGAAETSEVGSAQHRPRAGARARHAGAPLAGQGSGQGASAGEGAGDAERSVRPGRAPIRSGSIDVSEF